MILTEDHIKEIMKTPRNGSAIVDGGNLQSEHKVHITGEGYKAQVTQVEGFEDAKEFNIRKQISKPATMQITSIILDNLNRWISAQGTIKKVDFQDAEKDKAFLEVLNQVWRGDSMSKFIQTFYKEGIYIEFNGFTLATKPKIVTIDDKEYIEKDGIIEEKPEGNLNPYMIFIANCDVYDFWLTGDKVEYLIIKLGDKRFRLIDDEKDIIFDWNKGNDGRITEVSTIPNEIGYVPARKLSGINKRLLSSQVKTSPIDHIIPALDRYFSSDADLRMQFIRHNYPKLAIVTKECTACDGMGYSHDDKDTKVTCNICEGTGKIVPISRGGVIGLPEVINDGDTAYPGAPASYITPDTDSLRLGLEDLLKQREDIVYSGTGDKNLIAESLNTATENTLNSRSLEDRIREITMMIEEYEEFMIKAIKDLHKDFTSTECNITIRYGKRISTKSEDELLKEMDSSKSSGMPTSFVTALQRDLIYAKYKNNAIELQRQLLLSDVEPLSGYNVKEVKDMAEFISPQDLYLKVNFDSIIAEIETTTPLQFWMVDADYNKKVEALNKQINEILQGRIQRDADYRQNVAAPIETPPGD